MPDSLPSSASHAAANHFTLQLHAAIVALIDRLLPQYDTIEAALESFPFLQGYMNQLARNGLDGVPMNQSRGRWRELIDQWERRTEHHLPLRALRRAYGLGADELDMLLAAGLVDEEARFGAVFAALGSATPEGRPSAALLAELHSVGSGAGRAALHRLVEVGLLEYRHADGAQGTRAACVPQAIWSVISGMSPTAVAPGLSFRPATDAPALAELHLPHELRTCAEQLAAGLREAGRAIVLRGPRHNGRGSLAGALARTVGRGVLRLEWPQAGDDARWRLVGPLAAALDAVPLLAAEPAPGETLNLPPLPGLVGALFVVLGAHGGVAGERVDRALSIALEMPREPLRRLLWRGAMGAAACETLVNELASRYRWPSGNVQRVAALAAQRAALRARMADAEDVEAVLGTAGREGLQGLATPISTAGHWTDLVADSRTSAELATLERRCRHREQLPDRVGASLAAQMNAGVRALFRGPSGTGKTLSARLLAAALRKELYRIDLSAVVNKYIGETEKNLNRVFDRAEELDVVLLLDEGDALLGKRTGVQNANDRYANLETNFLLQRLESFGGILVVTTNAPEHVDTAFRRRMDAVIDFPAPQARERLAIWALHLPPAHAVDADFLEEVALRCALTGGQIRNAVLHASLLALERGREVDGEHLEAALQREYRKTGAICPLRSRAAAAPD